MNEVLWRLILLAIVGYVAYRILLRRKKKIRTGNGLMGWKLVMDSELEHLKLSVPVEHYVNLLALSRSEMTDQECIAQLDQIAEEMKKKEANPQPVIELIQKIRSTVYN